MSNQKELQTAFELATLRGLMDDIGRLSGEAANRLWSEAGKAINEYAAARHDEELQNKRFYKYRVEAEEAVIRNEQIKPVLIPAPPRQGRRILDDDMIHRIARHRVDRAHQDRMATLDQGERDALHGIKKQARRLLRKHGQAQRAFKRAVEGRTRRQRGPKLTQ